MNRRNDVFQTGQSLKSAARRFTGYVPAADAGGFELGLVFPVA